MGQFWSAVRNCNSDADGTNNMHLEKKRKLIDDMKRSVNSSKKILNIAVLGLAGCGKSSFINTAITSMRTDKWNQHAKAGRNSQNTSSITHHYSSYSASYYLREEPNVYLPTFIDVNGLENDEGGFNDAFLRAFLEGKIKEREDLIELYEMFKENEDRVIEELSQRPNYLKIDRIIVVTTADPLVPLPNNLFKCIRRVANCFGGIPIFGVMTKKDKFKHDAQIHRRTDDFLSILGIDQNSFAWIQNYCPDVDNQMTYHTKVFPYIDVPVLSFLTQVTYSRPYDSSEEKPSLLERTCINVLEWACYFIQIAIFLHWSIFVKIVIYQHKKKDVCAEYESLIKYFNLALPAIVNICNEISNFQFGFLISIIVSISVFLFTFSISATCRKLKR